MPLSPEIYQRIIRAKQFMDNQYHQYIDLAQIAREACLSRFHFHRLFKQVYHTTPRQYITDKRISQAKWLLAGNKTVAEVCHTIGFESIGSFCLLFKKGTGISPARYRSQALIKKQREQSSPRQCIPHCFLSQYRLDKESNIQ